MTDAASYKSEMGHSHTGEIVAVIGISWLAALFPLGSWLGKKIKAARQAWTIPAPGLHDVPDMTGRQIGMDFLVADLNHDARASNPQEGDVVIVLDICGMGAVVNRDRRGRFLPGVRHQEPVAGEPHRPEFDSFTASVEGEPGLTDFKRYEIRPCGLAARTWVVAR